MVLYTYANGDVVGIDADRRVLLRESIPKETKQLVCPPRKNVHCTFFDRQAVTGKEQSAAKMRINTYVIICLKVKLLFKSIYINILWDFMFTIWLFNIAMENHHF